MVKSFKEWEEEKGYSILYHAQTCQWSCGNKHVGKRNESITPLFETIDELKAYLTKLYADEINANKSK